MGWIQPSIRFLAREGIVVLLAPITVIVLYELRATDPARYRRPIADLIAFIFNTGVLVGLWLIGLAAAVALPTLSRH